MAMPFKDRYKRNKDILEWYDALAVAVAVIALVFTFGLRVVQVDGCLLYTSARRGCPTA